MRASFSVDEKEGSVFALLYERSRRLSPAVALPPSSRRRPWTSPRGTICPSCRRERRERVTKHLEAVSKEQERDQFWPEAASSPCYHACLFLFFLSSFFPLTFTVFFLYFLSSPLHIPKTVDLARGEKIFKTKCAQCHVAEKGGGHKQVSEKRRKLDWVFLFLRPRLLSFFLPLPLFLSSLFFVSRAPLFLARVDQAGCGL